MKFDASFVLCGLQFLTILQTALNSENQDKKDEKGKKKNPYMVRFHAEANGRPTKCQVCRVLATELLEQIKKTDRKDHVPKAYRLEDVDNPDRMINYEKSEIRLYEILDGLCDRMKLYRARPGPEFPYIKGAKSHLREILDNIMEETKVKLNYELPDEVVEDHTYEVVRLKFKCVHMLEEYEDDITSWYFKHQEDTLMDWLCGKIALTDHERGCLTESTEMPADFYDFAKVEVTQPTPEPGKIHEIPDDERVEL